MKISSEDDKENLHEYSLWVIFIFDMFCGEFILYINSVERQFGTTPLR